MRASDKMILVISNDLSITKTVSPLVEPTSQLVPIPYDYPANCIDYLGKIDLILINSPDIKDCKIEEWKKHTLSPIIVLTKKSNAQTIQKAYRQGATDVLFTPIDEDEFTDALQRISNAKNISKTEKKRQKGLASVSIISPIIQKMMPIKLQATEPDVDLSIQFLGIFSVFANGQYLLKGLSKKRQSLLAYLLFHFGKKINKNRLMDIFWEDTPRESARNSLNVTIHAIRRLFTEAMPGENVLLYENGCYFINPVLRIETDIGWLNRHWQKGKAAERKGEKEAAAKSFYAAYAYYKGDFLENLHTEPWTGAERENLAEIYVMILARLSQYFSLQQDWDTAKQLAKLMLQKDDCLEEAYQILMQCAIKQQATQKVIRLFNQCRERLKEKLNVAPSSKTVQLFEQIRLKNN